MGEPSVSGLEPGGSDSPAQDVVEVPDMPPELRELAGWIVERPEPPHGWADCPSCGGLSVIPAELRPDPDLDTCRACGGLGQRLTGSRNAQAQTIVCTVCTGNGYIRRAPTPGQAPAAEPVPLPVAGAGPSVPALAPATGALPYEPYVVNGPPATGQP